MSKNFAVIGDPIEHSLSPIIHSLLFKRYDKDATYRAILLPTGQACQLRELMQKEDLAGANVTMPHKQAVIAFLDEVDSNAQKMGSVNTIVAHNGKLCGFCTDAAGLLLSLKRAGVDINGKRILILGAGGAASAIAHAYAPLASSISISNRQIQSTIALVKELQKEGFCADGGSLEEKELEQAAAQADLIINATPLGMKGKDDFASLDFLQYLPPQSAVCDLIYSPPETKLVQEAKRLGHIAVGGLGMLVYQAILSFSLFWDMQLDPAEQETAASQVIMELLQFIK